MPSVFWEPAGVVPQRTGRHNQQTIRAFLNTREPELIGVGLCLRFVSVFALVRYCLNGVRTKVHVLIYQTVWDGCTRG